MKIWRQYTGLWILAQKYLFFKAHSKIMSAERQSDPVKFRTLRKLLLPVFIALVLYYAVMALVGSARKISELDTQYGLNETENPVSDIRIFSDSEYVNLTREKAYLKARITMAASDSINLALDLQDSTAILELNGVELYKAGIQKIRIDGVLGKVNEYSLNELFTYPFTVKMNFSTIQKEPVMLKIAPRDTTEYKPDILPDTANTEPVYFMLEMNNGLRLYVYQSAGNERGALRGFFFDLTDRFRNCWNIIKSIFILRVPEYHPYIRITIPKNDARIIYRALPRHGQIAIHR
jgi:hypothetical protein